MLDALLNRQAYLVLSACFFLVVGCGLSAGPRYPTYGNPSRIVEESKSSGSVKILKKTAPELLDYDELVSLSLNPVSDDVRLKKKVESLFNKSFVENRTKSSKTFRVYPKLGESLRVVSWNMEQSLKVKELAEALRGKEAYLMRKGLSSSGKNEKALFERELMRGADIVVLQEMDIGHPRSHYLNTPKFLAEAWGMNYAYGLQYLEVDPIYLGIGDDHLKNKDALRSAASVQAGEEPKYHGAFGNAVLSRYPIKQAKVIPLKGKGYDWYGEESESFDVLEYARRTATKTAFNQRPRRELKIGSRSFLWVDLHIPELPLETLTVINVHFEIKLSVDKRRRQLLEVLEQIKGIENPVVLAGDFNSSLLNVSPTSIPKVVKTTLTTPSQLADILASFIGFVDVTRAKSLFNFAKNHTDPLATHVPILLENAQQATFRTLRDFRFEDGGSFDFRGDADHSWGKRGVLSNSNQRDLKGFASTFRVKRPIGPIGREKLDWILVKSFLRSPNDARGSRRLAPHYAQILKEFNRSGKMEFSDHDPITVLLPVWEPEVKNED